MKKIIYIAFAAILAGLAISCQKEEVVSDKTDVVQYTFNITVNDRVGFDDDASTKGSESHKTAWENGDRIFLFFKPTSGNLLTDTYATLTYNGSSWRGLVTGSTSLGEKGTLSAVYVYNLGSDVTPVFSDSKWTIATGNTFYSCQREVSYTVSDNNEISASLNLEAPADFVQFYVEGATGILTCNKVKGWKDVSIRSDLTVSNVTCTGYMNGFVNSREFGVLEYYGRIVNGGTSLKDVPCEFSVVRDGKVYEHAATPETGARSFKMDVSDLDNWTLAPGKLPGLFTVGKGEDGKAGTADDVQVRFSQGNLVATIDENGAPTNWKFAENQYDCLGEGGANKNIGNTTTSGTAGDVDLFGWSTSDNSGASSTDNYGIKTSTSTTDYSGDFYDWGKAYCEKNSITPDNTWRTLSTAEWQYLFNYGSHKSEVRNNKYKYGVTVCGKANCVVLLPDNWEWDETADEHNVGTGWQTEGYPETQTSNEVTWEKMEKAGAVCLPAAGYRSGSIVNTVGGSGYYWSSTAVDNSHAYYVLFYSDLVSPGNSGLRNYGYSVRLITELK